MAILSIGVVLMIGSGLGYFRNDDAEEYGRYGEDGPAAKTNLKANTSLGGYGDCRAEKGAISGSIREQVNLLVAPTVRVSPLPPTSMKFQDLSENRRKYLH
jgi:hypothetical protein